MRPPADAALHTRLDQAFLKADPAATVEALRAQVELATRLQLRSLCVPPLLAGTVKKKMGLVLASETDKSGVRRYRIAGDAGEGGDRSIDVRYMTPAE